VLKSKLRKKFLKIRKLKNKKNIQIKFDKVFNIINKQNISIKTIGGYFPINYEVDDLNILKEFDKRKYKISLPVIKKNFEMNFYKWSFNDPLKVNKYGIPEPETIKLVYPDVILIPLVAFDKQLNRLGYGGGYYDRLIKKISKKKNILKIGLALSVQKNNNIPINEYDKKLDYILTDKYII
jgi:5-formyltetrahydrofolate cyclo-ligase